MLGRGSKLDVLAPADEDGPFDGAREDLAVCAVVDEDLGNAVH